MKKRTALFLKVLPFLFLLITTFTFGQTVIVKGEAVDSSGNLLPGVSVLVEGTTNGITTDFDGKYVINIRTLNATLIFSYLGFETKKITVGEQKIINVILKESLDELGGIQVVAFSKQK